MAETLQIAKALHALVAWGLTPAQVQRHSAITGLLAVRKRALQRFGQAGRDELAQAATHLICEVVALQPSAECAAAQELLWIANDGPRLRNTLPSAPKRRASAIKLLSAVGYFGEAHAPNEEAWRHGLEEQFFTGIAAELIRRRPIVKPPPIDYPKGGMSTPRTNPNLDYDLLMVEAEFELFDEQHACSVIERTVRAKRDGVINYEIGLAVGVGTIEQVKVIGADIIDRIPPDSLSQHRSGLRFPNALREGDTHTFKVTQNVAEETDGFSYYFHAAGDNPAQELYVRVLFPSRHLPSAVTRVITRLDAQSRGGRSRAHSLEGREARTSFRDLQPGLAYGFRFHWNHPHDHGH